MIHLIRTYLTRRRISRDIEACLAFQRRLRLARSEAAKRGHTARWAKAGKQARAMFQ